MGIKKEDPTRMELHLLRAGFCASLCEISAGKALMQNDTLALFLRVLVS